MKIVFFYDLISSSGFMNFEIGSTLDLTPYLEGEDYNKIGTEGNGYYFFNGNVDVEVYTKNGLIHSFDILLRNQTSDIYLGSTNGYNFKINNCSIDELLVFFNRCNLSWKFDEIVSDKSISLSLFLKLKICFYFDFDLNVMPSLSLITIKYK